jgi:hypothetical protein
VTGYAFILTTKNTKIHEEKFKSFMLKNPYFVFFVNFVVKIVVGICVFRYVFPIVVSHKNVIKIVLAILLC